MASKFSINLQVALSIDVEIEAENFEQAVAEGRLMVRDSARSTHMLKRAMAKTDQAVSIQDTEAHLIGVRNDDAGCMYK